jgi:hypothetical protein
MTGKHHKLTRWNEDKGETQGKQQAATSWVSGEQQERSEQQMEGAPGAEGRGVSDAGRAGNPDGMPSGTRDDIIRSGWDSDERDAPPDGGSSGS